MAERKDNKKSSGAGKFVVGALIGTLAGAIASRFISVNVSKEEDFEDFDEDDCACGECECKKPAEVKEKREVKAKTTKKSDK
jgi:hypothetical protein